MGAQTEHPCSLHCRLAAFLTHGNNKAREDTAEQREAFKYSLGMEHSEEKSFVHILNSSSASRQRCGDIHPVENCTETLN